MPDFDLLTAGFPCQPFSTYGKCKGFEDCRSDISQYLIGIIKLKNPKYVLFENTATLLNHDNDPVTKFTLSSFYSMPDWLKAFDRGRGVHPAQRWLPGIAFFQGLIDTKNAATVIPGEFNSTGHDYRADLASFVSTAFRFEDVSDEQMERIEERLRHSEVERAANISEGKLQTA